MLCINALTKRIKEREIVSNVFMQMERGEVIGLIGPNGAGKTSTFYLLIGLLTPDSGTIFLDDKEINKLAIYQRSRLGLSYLPQEPSVFRKLTVSENLFIILDNFNISRKEKVERVKNAMSDLGIEHLANKKALYLSGGERRRVEIARTLLIEPKYLLLDEPYAGIEPLAIQEIKRIIKTLKDRNIGVVISDHNVRDTLQACDRAYLIKEGKVWLQGTPKEIVENADAKRFYLGEEFNIS